MNTFRVHFNLGTALANQNEYDGAIRHYTAALNANERYVIPASERSKAHSNLAAVLAKQGRLGEAVEHCFAALEIDSNFVEARNNLGGIITHQSGIC